VSFSQLPGPWRWEQRGDSWWRVHDDLHIEDGPHPEPIQVADDDVMPDRWEARRAMLRRRRAFQRLLDASSLGRRKPHHFKPKSGESQT